MLLSIYGILDMNWSVTFGENLMKHNSIAPSKRYCMKITSAKSAFWKQIKEIVKEIYQNKQKPIWIQLSLSLYAVENGRMLRCKLLVRSVSRTWFYWNRRRSDIKTSNECLYLHVTFGGICAIQQRLISCLIYWKTTLRI